MLGTAQRSRLDWIARGAAWVTANSSDIANAGVVLLIQNTRKIGLSYGLYGLLVWTNAVGTNSRLGSVNGHFGTPVAQGAVPAHTPNYGISPLKLDQANQWLDVAVWADTFAAPPAATLWTGSTNSNRFFTMYPNAPLVVIPPQWSLEVWTDVSGLLSAAALLGPWS